MKKEKSKEWEGKDIRIRPRAVCLDTGGGHRFQPIDDRWKVGKVDKSIVNLTNLRTGHVIALGLDNVKEWRSPDFLLLRAQLKLKGSEVDLDPILITSVDKNLTGFESLLEHSWRKEFVGHAEVWISEVDNMFQIEIGETQSQGDFAEEWTRVFPDRHTSSYPVYLKVGGVGLKELTFVACDGGRFFMPLPEIKPCGDSRRFFYYRDSLRVKVAEVIGRYYIHADLEETAQRCGIEMLDSLQTSN